MNETENSEEEITKTYFNFTLKNVIICKKYRASYEFVKKN